MANDYAINYEDDRFKQVESDKKAAISENEKLYGDMINESDKYYQAQIDASKEWADKQTQLQQEQTDFAIEKIEQNKAQAKKDYTKEQSGAYVDWQKQSNQHGVRAEQLADKGMQTTGYSESSQVSMYNTYQNRVATARESYNIALQNYNNSITEARLQNNSALAEIAYKALQQQLELSLQGFQYKNQLLLDKANQKIELENNYYNRYQDVLSQINTENALAEQIRQFNASLAEEQRQFDAQMARSYSSGGGGGSSRSYSRSSGGSSSSGSGSINKSSSSSIAKGASGASSGGSIDTKSVLASGLGPASGATIAKAVNSGTHKATSNGKTVTISKNTPTALLKYSKYNF